MSLVYNMQQVRERLLEFDAEPATVSLVDQILARASEPSMERAPSQSQLQIVRMLIRHPIADSNTDVYNDLVKLEEDLDNAAVSRRAEQDAADSKPVPKSKKYYKELKDKQRSGQ